MHQIRARKQVDNAPKVTLAQVGIDFGRLDRPVAEEFLDRTDVPGSHHYVAREGVPPGH